MKIVVMSDTHLARINDDFKALCSQYCESADLVVHLGDWEKVEILNYLDQYPLEAVAGNMDDHAIHQQLPTKKTFRAGDFRIGIIHGWGSPGGIRQRITAEVERVDAILFGHTHQPLLIHDNGLLWFNPGSVYHGRGVSKRTIGILQIQDRIEAEIVQI